MKTLLLLTNLQVGEINSSGKNAIFGRIASQFLLEVNLGALHASKRNDTKYWGHIGPFLFIIGTHSKNQAT